MFATRCLTLRLHQGRGRGVVASPAQQIARLKSNFHHDHKRQLFKTPQFGSRFLSSSTSSSLTPEQQKPRALAAERAKKSTARLLSLIGNKHGGNAHAPQKMPITMVQECLNAISFWCSHAKLQENANLFKGSISGGNGDSTRLEAFEAIITADRLLRFIVDNSILRFEQDPSPTEYASGSVVVPIAILHAVLDTYRICVDRYRAQLHDRGVVDNDSNGIDENVDSATELAQRVQSLFHYLAEASLRLKGMKVLPDLDVFCCNIVLDTMAKSGDASNATHLLQQMEQAQIRRSSKTTAELWHNNLPPPDIVSYNTCITAWIHVVKAIGSSPMSHYARVHKGNDIRNAWEAAQKAENILDRMKTVHSSAFKNKNRNFQCQRGSAPVPDTISYTSVIVAFSQCPPSQDMKSINRAQELLDEMLQAYAASPNSYIKPNVMTFGAVLRGWAQHSHLVPQAAQKADELLQCMESLYDQRRDPDLYPTTICYNIVIDAWSRSTRRGAAGRAEQILVKLSNVARSLKHPTMPPEQRNTKQVQSKGDEQAEDELIRPNLYSYNSVLNAYAKSRDYDSGKRAESLLAAMEQEFESGNQNARPDTVSFTAVIDALSKSPHDDSARRAHALLSRMIDLWNAGDESVRPNKRTFTAVIDAYAKSRERDAVKRAEGLLSQMSVLAKEQGHSDMMPNTMTYNTLLNCLARRGEAEKAEHLLQKMMLMGGTDGVRADTFSFNSCMNAWANTRRPQAATRVTNLLDQMHSFKSNSSSHVKPGTITYNSALNAIANSGLERCSDHAEKIFNDMESSGVEKDAGTYNALFNAYAKNQGYDSPEGAEKALFEMCDNHLRQSGPAPDARSFNTVLNAWARSTRRDKAERAFQLLNNMGSSSLCNIAPDTISYNTAMNACATCNDFDPATSKRSLEILLQIMTILGESKNVKEDVLSFTTTIKAVKRLCIDVRKREKLSEALFDRCCASGLVNTDVLRVLHSTAPGVHSGLQHHQTNGHFPREWTQNASPRHDTTRNHKSQRNTARNRPPRVY
jgi:pentatricopeptide repeat protein